MKTINYLVGDATSPISLGNKIIVHICNDIGGWGKGFVMALSAKWKEPESEYRNWFQSQKDFVLGEVQIVKVSDEIFVANLIGQRKINKDENGNPPIRYNAIEIGLEKISIYAQEYNASIHMPRIGCGLAGGKWEIIEPLIIKYLSKNDIEVNVYDFI
jgi:O-acetyl-ADP-ribose deacetylase (regulator of RNase III)